jgi:hypothetical protein
MPLSPDAFDEGKARAVAWLTAWDSQGTHRTGTSGDEAGAVWLAHEAASFGIEVTTETFELDRLDPVTCYLELDGEPISAVPAFDAPPTGADGVTGTLNERGGIHSGLGRSYQRLGALYRSRIPLAWRGPAVSRVLLANPK